MELQVTLLLVTIMEAGLKRLEVVHCNGEVAGGLMNATHQTLMVLTNVLTMATDMVWIGAALIDASNSQR